MSAGRRNRLLVAVAVASALWAAGAIVLAAKQRDRERNTGDGSVAIVGERPSAFRAGPLPRGVDRRPAPKFTLADARGGRLNTGSLKGRPYLVTFLYTDCQDVCPLIAQEIKLALEQLGARGRQVTALAVSADPQVDTPQAVRAWLDERRMPANFRYLIGTRQELKPVWRAHYAAPQPHDKEESAHSASIWLVDRQGRWRAKFSGGMPVPPRDIAHDLRVLLDEPGR